ncbi:MAG: hypothetical protein RBQ97_09210 [Acholeplasma sp.]|nr:hypothetical protein [Acholeplasma sp.]
MKNNTNQLLSYLILVILFNPIYLFSQEQPDERKIKGSKEYYWGQAYNQDSTKACMEARDALMLKVSNQISKSSNLNAKSDIMVKCIRYMYKPVEDLIKVVAYVPIVDVTNIIENKEPLIIKEIKYTEEETTSVIESPKEIGTSSIEEPIEDVPNEIIVIKDNPVTENLSLLDQIIACNTAYELKMIIQREEKKNTLIYNWDSKPYRKRNSSEPFYIVIIDPSDNKIIAFLEKGKTVRKDLKHPSRTINILSEYQNYIQVWLQLF